MDARAPMVVRLVDGVEPAGPPTPGMDRRQLIEDGDRWFGWARTTPGMASGWHHHGDRDTYEYLLRGAIRFEYGDGGREWMVCAAGDVAYVPAGTVHREITEPGEAGEAFVVRIGSGPHTVNVDGPDPIEA